MVKEKELLFAICEIGIIDKTDLNPKKVQKYRTQLAQGLLKIKKTKTCFLHFTNKRMLAETMPEKKSTSIGVFGVGVPIHKKEISSTMYLHVPYSEVIQYMILNMNIKKGDNTNLTMETENLFCSFAPTDHRHMDAVANAKLLQKISELYKQMGLLPRTAWGSEYFNVQFSTFLQHVLNDIFSGAAARKSKKKKKGKKKKIKKKAKKQPPAPAPEDENVEKVLECPMCGEESAFGVPACEHCFVEFDYD